MRVSSWRPRDGLRAFCLMAVLAASVAMTGCISMYVDGNVPETPKAAFRVPAKAPAVQFVFEFQTKGAPNQRATDLLKEQVKAQVMDSGLFASVSEGPAPGAGLMTFTLNNVPLSDDAARKGFVTGLTFGLAGSTVADGYEATLRYVPASGGGMPVTHAAKHIIHTSLGSGGPPAGAVKTSSAEEAIRMMARQVLSRVLADLSKDPAFPAGQANVGAAEAGRQL